MEGSLCPAYVIEQTEISARVEQVPDELTSVDGTFNCSATTSQASGAPLFSVVLYIVVSLMQDKNQCTLFVSEAKISGSIGSVYESENS